MPLRHRALLPALVVVALAVGGAACSDDELTPEEARFQRVEERLKLSFPDEQVACMLDEFDESILVALDGEGNLPQGADLDVFSATARRCVLGEDATTPAEAGSSTAPSPTAPADGDDAPADSEPAPDPEPVPETEPEPADDTTPAPGPGDTRPETGPADGGDGG